MIATLKNNIDSVNIFLERGGIDLNMTSINSQLVSNIANYYKSQECATLIQ